MKKHLLSVVLAVAMMFAGSTGMQALETYDFQELCMKLGKGGPWAVNDGGDAGFTIVRDESEAVMHLLGDYTDQGFTWNGRFAYEYVDGRGKFTMRNKNNKKDSNCGMFSWDYSHYFSILGLKDGDKVTITIGTGTVTFVNETAEGVTAGDNVTSKQAYTIATTEETTRLDIEMAKATLIAKIEIEPYGVETVPVISVSPATLKLIPTATAKLTASVSPSMPTTWASSDESIVTVDADGTVTAVAPGTATVSNSWQSETSDAAASGECVITVADVDLSAYNVTSSYDFTTMGDVTLELQEQAAGAIWNDANSKNNNVFFCTNEGLENIAVQAAVSSNKGWSIVDGQGLFLATGAGRCAAIGGIKAGQVVEFIYTGDGFYTRSDDDGVEKTALNEGKGRAIYRAEEDGMMGFELIKGNAVQQINVYEKEAQSSEAYISFDKSRLDNWAFPKYVLVDGEIAIPYQVQTYSGSLEYAKVSLVVNGEVAQTQKLGTVEFDEEMDEGTYTGLFTYKATAEGDITFKLVLDYFGAALNEGEGETEEVTIPIVTEVPAPEVLTDIAALKACTEATGDDVLLTLTDAKVTYVGTKTSIDWDTFEEVPTDVVVLEDASAGIYLEGSGLGAFVGKGAVLNGQLALNIAAAWDEVSGKLTNGMEGVTVTEGEATPLALNDDNLMDYIANPDWRLVSLDNVTITMQSGDYGDDYYINSELLGDAIGIQDVIGIDLGAIMPEAGAKCNVTGYVYSLYGGLVTAFQPLTIEVLSQPYKFVASEWTAGDPGRISPENVSADAEANTITVSQTGQNNVALIFRSANTYEVKAAQRYFVIKATGLSTADGASYLWWLNNTNNGSQIAPTSIYEENGQTVFAWDCATIAIGGQLGLSDADFKDDGGWSTTFGMTLADETVPAVFSYIGFQETVENPVEETEYEFVASEWPAGDPGRIQPSNVVVDEAANTITVDAQGDNNVALNFKSDKTYYLAQPVKYFVIQGTGLATGEGKSYLWWCNAKNNGAQEEPAVVNDNNGLITLAWDITANSAFASGFNTEGKSYLDGTGASTWGWTTTFGLTLADPAVPAVITYIGYVAEDSEIVTAIEAVSTNAGKNTDTVYNLAGQKVKSAKKGLYIINGKKMMVK